MAYNTGNSIGSTDPRDLYDNAQNIDEWANSESKLSHPDRFGVSRRTFHGMESEYDEFMSSFGYAYLGDYAAGIDVTASNQLVKYDGEYWKPAASASLPFTTSGTWTGDDDARFVSVGDAALRSEIGSGVRRVSDIVSLRGISGRFAGDSAAVLGYYSAGDGGGGPARVWVGGASAGTYVDNGGSIIVPTGGDGSAAWVWENPSWVNVDWFGAVGDGVTDDSAAVQACINYVSSLVVSPTPSLTGTLSTIQPFVEFSGKQYYLATPVSLGGYAFINGNNCVLSAPAGSGRVFTSTSGYRWVFKDVNFYGDDIEALYVDSPNLNNALFHFIGCHFSTYNVTANRFAAFIHNRSARVVFEECNARIAPNFLDVEADFVYIKGGWISGYGLNASGNNKPADSESIRLGAGTRYFRADNAVFIPEPQGQPRQEKARWISNHGARIHLKRCDFGAENSGLPIIYQFKQHSYDNSSGATPSMITVEDSQVSCGSASRTDAGVVVLQDGIVPGKWKFSQNTNLGLAPLISAAGHDYAGTDASRNAALSADILSLGNLDRIQMDVRADTWEGRVPNALIPYVNSQITKKALHVSPAKDAGILVVEGLKSSPNTSGVRSFMSFDLTVKIQFDDSGYYTHEKTYRVEVLSDATNAMESNITLRDFFEYHKLNTDKGDTTISLAQATGASNTSIGFEVTLDGTQIPGTVYQMSVVASEIRETNEVDGSGSNPAIVMVAA